MSKFARLFELPNENQVLLIIEYGGEQETGECFNVKASTVIDEVVLTVTFGFDKHHKALKMFDSFNMENAKALRDEMMGNFTTN